MGSVWRAFSCFLAAGVVVSAAPALAQSTDLAPPPPAAITPPAAVAAYDPFEPANRGVFKFSQGVDKFAIRPVALGYKAILPRPVRTGVRNVINNINEPNVVMNDVLQARLRPSAAPSRRAGL